MSRSREYQIRRLDRHLERLEAELSRLVYSRDPLMDILAQSRAEMIEDARAQIAAAEAQLRDLLEPGDE